MFYQIGYDILGYVSHPFSIYRVYFLMGEGVNFVFKAKLKNIQKQKHVPKEDVISAKGLCLYQV